MKLRLRNVLALLLTLALLLGCLPPISAVSTSEAALGTSDKSALSLGNSNEKVEIMVMLDGETTYVKTGDLELAAASADRQLTTLQKAELTIEKKIAAQIEVENFYSLLFNGFSFTGEAWMIDAINQIPGYTAFESPMMELIEPVSKSEHSLSSEYVSAASSIDTNYDYTGEGMVVAIIDSGILQTHEAFSVAPENAKLDEAYIKNIFAKYGDKIHAGNGKYTDGMYYNAKLPFNWDYFDDDAEPNHTASDHGTHVAGIAAGNNGKGFQGVAPDAQIVVMQVFTDSGGAAWTTILNALEDCVYLGVDAINMSLGLTAGYTAYSFIDDAFASVYEALENAGISVAVAAGNDTHSAVWTNFGWWYGYDYCWLSSNPDVGLVGAPSTFEGSFSVASVEDHSISTSGYLRAYGRDIMVTESYIDTTPTLSELTEGVYDIVYVGYGSWEEVEEIDLSDKIALIKRGNDISFDDKAFNAACMGAIAVIIFNDDDEVVTQPSCDIWVPFGFISKEDGEAILENLKDNEGVINVVHGLTYFYRTPIMSEFSSWGTTADLKIKPEISAAGTSVYSSVGFESDESYEIWDGTSMAAPSIAGGLLLVKQRLKEQYPEKNASEINNLAYAYLMDTAEQVGAFVRQQGAGLMNLEDALRSDAYLSVDGQSRPKLELDESDDGQFTFSFTIHNPGKAEKTYNISASVMTELVEDYDYQCPLVANVEYASKTGWYVSNPEIVTVKTCTGTVKDVTDLCNIDAPKTITVPAGEEITVTMTISCSMALMKYFSENCPNGMYLEGFVQCSDAAEDGVDLSIPFLGYVGDWDKPATIDSGYWWQFPYGENNLQQLMTRNYRYIGYGTLEQGLGLNYYADMKGQTYLEDRNAVSPNGDGLLDSVDYLEFSVLRNLKSAKCYMTDAEGNILQTIFDVDWLRKEYFTASFYGDGNSWTYTYFDLDLDRIDENETFYIVVETWLDHEGYTPEANESGYWVTPVTKDTIAPAVKVIENGIQVIDTNYTAYYAIYADEERTELIYENGVFATERGVAETYLTDLDCFYVFTADYARNEGFYKVEDGIVFDLNYARTSRKIVAQEQVNYNEGGAREYAWLSFDPIAPNDYTYLTEPTRERTEAIIRAANYDILSTGVGVDGTLYGNDAFSLYTINPETFEREKLFDVWTEDGSRILFMNLLINPVDYESYALINIGGAIYFAKLDMQTGELVPKWKCDAVEDDGWAAEFTDDGRLFLWNRIWGNNSQRLQSMDIETGEILETYELCFHMSNQENAQIGVQGLTGDMLYDKETNRMYVTSNYSWYRPGGHGYSGYFCYDFNTDTVTFHTVDNGAGLVIFGLFFPDEVKPAAFYTVTQLIDAIGEVTLGSGEAIEAAREAYDALSDKEKSYVTNYEDLVAAELRYAIIKAENASYQAALYYAKMVRFSLDSFDTSKLNVHQRELFNDAVADFDAALKSATTAEEVNEALSALLLVVENLDKLCPACAFADVDAGAWYHSAVDFVLDAGLMRGYEDGTFKPQSNMTRAEFVQVIYRAAGEADVEGLDNPFKDVKDGFWAHDAIVWAASEGYVNGMSADTFGPNETITREQIITIIYRIVDEGPVEEDYLADFADANAISDYAKDAMNWAVSEGILEGDAGKLRPRDKVTRAEVATIIMRID